ncbi:ABC transporter permease [Helcococcus massiliensis]|uniref:ABC transporter permease n=1 Tax=Helcococcus massiliensis TaxID=2040290 RepID=UPI000CDE8B3F|nr:FtsX-like permease family protein [Helcococcus massiliensis]
MIKNSLAYVVRKPLKTLILFTIILAMSTLSIVSLAIKSSTDKAKNETFKNISNSFIMEINRRTNPGTPRGAGNVKGEDLKKISETGLIDGYVKRISSVADLQGYDLVESAETARNQNPERKKNFGRAVMVTGINDSSKENTFVSESYKLVEGDHIKDSDTNKILMHKDLAQKNGLKIGDKIKLKSNIYDADNVKQANETVEVEIKGLFEGQNAGPVTVSQELYQNNIISDIKTAANLYGNTEDTATYLDSTFYIKGDKDIDEVMKQIQKLDIDWNSYMLVKSSSNYPVLQKTISGVYGLTNKMFIATMVFSGLIIGLILLLWINARKKEIAIYLSLGKTKMEVFSQFVYELLFISIPAFISSYFVAGYISKNIGAKLLAQVTNSVSKEIARQSGGTNLASGAEADGFNRTLTSLDVEVLSKHLLYVFAIGLVILSISLILASIKTMKKSPKELLTEIK